MRGPPPSVVCTGRLEQASQPVLKVQPSFVYIETISGNLDWRAYSKTCAPSRAVGKKAMLQPFRASSLLCHNPYDEPRSHSRDL